jgi:hypothetical protein
MPQFLTDEWVTAALELRQEFEGQLPAPAQVRINLVVTAVPFGEGDLKAHVDTTGSYTIQIHHLDDADVTLTLPYDMAKAILVEGDLQVAMQAFMAGQLRIEGDMAKAMSLQTLLQNPALLPLHQKLLAITD